MAQSPVDFVIRSLRGGMNDSDSPLLLDADQCVLAQNVEFTTSPLGERRKGSDGITLPASLSNKDRISFLHRHLPTSDESAAQLWAFGFKDSGSTYQLAYKDTSWNTVAMADAPTLTGFSPYQFSAVSMHGKLFIAYDSGVARLHVWDGTSFRKTGLAEPAAPTGANDGGVGTFAGKRYYRVRYIEMSGSTILRRSEPSDVLEFTPNGNDTGITVTKPAAISEGETHWELEASTGGVDFYVIATTVVGTGTYTDTQDFVTDYVEDFPLSEDAADYTLIPSARYLVADEDRLIFAGDHEDAANASAVGWTPVFNNPGKGNDERRELDTDPSLSLDGYEGGAVTGMARTVLGSIWIFKQSHIYKMTRTNSRRKAYTVFNYTKSKGALHGSVVAGIDQTGSACVYFLDPATGPNRIGGPTGEQQCGADIRKTWKRINLDATKAVCTGYYDPEKRQVHWTIALDGANLPTYEVVIQTDCVRDKEDGARGGISVWTGGRTGALCACLFADNIDAGVARSRTLVPFLGVEGGGLILRTETDDDDDNGTAFGATITTKPYAPGNIINQFGVLSGCVVATAAEDVTFTVRATKDFGVEELTPITVDCSPDDAETHVIKYLDNFKGARLRTLQVTFADSSPATGRWELHAFVLKPSAGQTG